MRAGEKMDGAAKTFSHPLNTQILHLFIRSSGLLMEVHGAPNIYRIIALYMVIFNHPQTGQDIKLNVAYCKCPLKVGKVSLEPKGHWLDSLDWQENVCVWVG